MLGLSTCAAVVTSRRSPVHHANHYTNPRRKKNSVVSWRGSRPDNEGVITHETASALRTTPDRILRPRELSERLGLSLPTLWRLRRRGDLLEPIRLSPNCIGWRLSDIERWLNEREAGR